MAATTKRYLVSHALAAFSVIAMLISIGAAIGAISAGLLTRLVCA